MFLFRFFGSKSAREWTWPWNVRENNEIRKIRCEGRAPVISGAFWLAVTGYLIHPACFRSGFNILISNFAEILINSDIARPKITHLINEPLRNILNSLRYSWISITSREFLWNLFRLSVDSYFEKRRYAREIFFFKHQHLRLNFNYAEKWAAILGKVWLNNLNNFPSHHPPPTVSKKKVRKVEQETLPYHSI